MNKAAFFGGMFKHSYVIQMGIGDIFFFHRRGWKIIWSTPSHCHPIILISETACFYGWKPLDGDGEMLFLMGKNPNV